MHDLDFTEIRSENILFVRGNKSHASAVWKIEQVKNL